jgi:hypothetical protein
MREVVEHLERIVTPAEPDLDRRRLYGTFAPSSEA